MKTTKYTSEEVRKVASECSQGIWKVPAMMLFEFARWIKAEEERQKRDFRRTEPSE